MVEGVPRCRDDPHAQSSAGEHVPVGDGQSLELEVLSGSEEIARAGAAGELEPPET